MSELYDKALLLAEKVMGIARDSILVNMRFLDTALSALRVAPEKGAGGISLVFGQSDGAENVSGLTAERTKIAYDPVFLLMNYKEEPAFAVRIYLHILFHMIFSHSFRFDRLDQENWSLAADMAVEAAILELELPGISLMRDEEARRKLNYIREEIHSLTAEKIYRYLQNFPISDREREELEGLFHMDSHRHWKPSEALSVSAEQWRKLSERVQADLKSFSRGAKAGQSESLEKSLLEAVRERHSYRELLQKFMVMNEDLRVNDEEFDYIYYTYGLSCYGNMPLVEPLEYKDSRKVREFVIAIDTSASCRGEVVRSFLRKTYAILTGEDTFFRKMNVHIIQCDYEVQRDTRITSRQELDFFLSHEKLTGFGSTDFRPVFTYVNELIRAGEFENLKGMLYFTDGYGVYPKAMPPYQVMFVFPDNGDEGPQVPSWAVKVLMEEEEGD